MPKRRSLEKRELAFAAKPGIQKRPPLALQRTTQNIANESFIYPQPQFFYLRKHPISGKI
jgi:hypothetical protein